MPERALRRALEIDGRPYTLLLDELGLKLTEKGRRLGLEIRWIDLVSGDAALTAALNASLVAPLGLARDSDDRPQPERPGGRGSPRSKKISPPPGRRRSARRAASAR